MRAVSNVESLFSVINESAQIIQNELDCPYIEAVAETGENLFNGEVVQESISELSKKKLNNLYQSVRLSRCQNEEIRKAFQLAALKGLKESSLPMHQMTPDSVGIFIGYLFQRFFQERSKLTILDPAVGTGNLLSCVLNQLLEKQIQSIGIDIDDLLIKIAYVNANLQEHSVELYNQDSLKNLFVDPVDAVVCDLPVGYYPDDEWAGNFELKAEEGHSYAHHLFIEQSIRYTKQGGYLFFLIPDHLFETPEAKKLHHFLKKHAVIQGLLRLPSSMFKAEEHRKSIFILQKKGEGIVPPKQVLLADLPRFSNKKALLSVIAKIDNWYAVNKTETGRR